MANYQFPAVAGTTIASFSVAADTLTFPGGYSATSLSVTADGADALVTYGGQSVRLQGVSAAALTGTQFSFADGMLYRQGVAGNDSLAGSTGDDLFVMGAGGNDTLTAGAGNDVVRLGGSLTTADRISGGTGQDEAHFGGNYAAAVALGASTLTGFERFTFGPGGTVRLQLHQAVFDTADGAIVFEAGSQGVGDATLLDGSGVSGIIAAHGGAGGDSLLGGTANDPLSGDAGSDSLAGGAGADTIDGGLDADTLSGGTGGDRFVFYLGSPRTTSSPTTIDTITDFAAGDLIDLPGVNSFNGKALVFNADPLQFNYTGGSSGQQDFVNEGDGFADVYWRNNTTAGRLELWVDGNDDGQFSETDLLVYLPNTVTGKTALSFTDFADNFVAWRGTAGADTYAGNDAANTAYALAGNDVLATGTGRDSVYGGEGNDSLRGEGDDDLLFGGSGSDTLYGGDGNDGMLAVGANSPAATNPTDATSDTNLLHGEAGNDSLRGSEGRDQMFGGADNDDMSGYGNNDSLSGGDGNDQLQGHEGDDTLDGGDGRDYLLAGANLDQLYMGAGLDQLFGGAGDDTLYAGGTGQVDTLVGGADADWLYALVGPTVLTGGTGADRFMVSAADSDDSYSQSNLIQGSSSVEKTTRITDFNEAEGDRIRSGITSGMSSSDPLVWRGVAAAAFTATLGQSVSLAGSQAGGSRFLEFWVVRDTAAGRTSLFIDRNLNGTVDASDVLIAFDGLPTLSTNSFTPGTFSVKIGTGGADTNVAPALTEQNELAFALDGNDTLDGLGGNDTINADGGNDSLLGGLGQDWLLGGTGTDQLNGGDDNDRLDGGTGADTLTGGDGNDQLSADGTEDSTYTAASDAPGTINLLLGGAGSDGLQGGAGDDRLEGGADDDFGSGGGGNDLFLGGTGNDQLNGGDGNDTVRGEEGNDTLAGGNGNDSVEGGIGDDLVLADGGVGGRDTISGGDGNDTLYGLGDFATLTGGAGADRFVFSSVSGDTGDDPTGSLMGGLYSTVASADRVTDFNAAQGDLIRSGLVNGRYNSVPLIWRGTADSAFKATLGQSVALASSESQADSFYEFWTGFDSGLGVTFLFVDRNRNGTVDDNDLRIEFDGNVALSQSSFTAGTFTTKVGTSGADSNTTPALTEDPDLAYAFGGNDTLSGLGGDDSLRAGAGDDQLEGGTGRDFMLGEAGNDSLSGGADGDVLEGGTGSDTLRGADGADALYAEDMSGNVPDAAAATNLLEGGAGNDSLIGSAGVDQLVGGTESDYLSGKAGNDSLLGEQGQDNLIGGAGDDTLIGGDDNDNLVGDEGTDLLDGGLGNDGLKTGLTGATVDTLLGGAGDDTLTAQGENGVLSGGTGADLFAFDNSSVIVSPRSTVAQPVRVTDFNMAEGDLVRSGIYGVGGPMLVWRGTAPTAFTATLGQSLSLAGSDVDERRFHEVWRVRDTAGNKTILYIDSDASMSVTEADFKVVFDGDVPLTADAFTPGTFFIKAGTSGADSNTSPVLTPQADLAFGLAGNDTLAGLDGQDSINGDAGNDTLTGGPDNDRVHGGAGADVLEGDAGRDTLSGGAGADTLRGGEDADSLFTDGYVDSVTGRTELDAVGTPNLLIGGAGADSLWGSYGDDQLQGDADEDRLDGDAGNDTLLGGDGADTLQSGAGDDSVDGGAGNDVLIGGDGFGGKDTLSGGEGNDELQGGYMPTVLTGGLGADRFDFASGGTIVGGTTSNLERQDRVTDFNAAQGDILPSGITQGMAGSVPLVWRGAAAAAFTATLGQSLDLAGGSAQDARYYEFWTVQGGGQTVLFMDTNRDRLVDNQDLRIVFDGQPVLSAASFTAGTFTVLRGTAGNDGAAALPATADADQRAGALGNDNFGGGGGNDWLAGNAGNDTIDGGAGFDQVLGGAGNDSLRGGDDVDQLYGGSGSDTLDGGGGSDYLYAATNEDFVGDTALDAETAANRLAGGAGNDWLESAAGSDTLSGGDGEDYQVGNAGNDSMMGDAGNDSLYGGTGNDTLDGGAGTVNVMDGGDGNDTYVLRQATDLILNEYYSSGIDTVLTYLPSLTLQQYLERGTIRLTTGASLTGNALDNGLAGAEGNDTLTAGEGNDTLDGAGGNDNMTGGVGDDTYYVNQAGDIVSEGANEGIDTIVTSVSLSIEDTDGAGTQGASVENLRLAGTGNINGKGNVLANVIYAGAGVNQIDGGAGIDTVSYLYATTTGTTGVQLNLGVVNASGQSAASGISGADLVKNVENITGSDYADSLTGSAAANVLDGGKGADTLAGAAGNDTYYVDRSTDIVQEAANAGVDTIVSTVSLSLADTDGAGTLGGNVENLRLAGSGPINGKGNTLNNTIFASDGVNELDGASGKDTLSYVYATSTWSGGVTLNLGVTVATGHSTASGASGADLVRGFENIAGSNYDDNFGGSASSNIFDGGKGNDTLSGAAGNDLLIGGDGVDLMSGGIGNDVFDFNRVLDSAPGAYDTITDFSPTSAGNTANADRIDLSSIDANAATTGVNEAFAFIGTAAFSGTDATGQLRFDAGTRMLYGSTNADASAEFAVQLLGVSALAAGDFIL